VVWQALRTNRVAGLHFRRQHVIAGFIVDFYCHAAALLVEVDGPVHVEQAGHDDEREAILESLGLMVLRITDQEIFRDLVGVLERIRMAAGVASP
jgi:very-short-patch-repair endonuclease